MKKLVTLLFLCQLVAVLFFCLLLVAGCATNGQSPVVETAGKAVGIVTDPNVLEALGTVATVIGMAGGGAYFLAGGLVISAIVTLIKGKKKGETQ